jgi:hypothetical protein
MPPLTIISRTLSETEALLHGSEFSPTEPSFDAARLRAEVELFGDRRPHDFALVEYAIWTAEAIRTLDARRVAHPFHQVRPLDRMQVLLSLAHHVVTDRHQAALDHGTGKGLESGRKPQGRASRGVSKIRPQEALETVIDSMIYVVNDSLVGARSSREGSEEGITPDSIGTEAVYEYFAFASEYRTIVARWQRVMLPGVKLQRNYAHWNVESEPSYGKRAAVGEFRKGQQQISDRQQRLRTWNHLGTPKSVVMGVRMPSRRTHSFREDGWVWRFEAVSSEWVIDDAAKLDRTQISGAMYAWIAELAEEVFDEIGTTGRGLLEAWLVLRELARSFVEEEGEDGLPPPPLVLHDEDLVAHLVLSLECSDEQAAAYLQFLRNDGQVLHELYGHPLIDFGPGNILVFIPGLLHADVERVMVRWLSQNLKTAKRTPERGRRKQRAKANVDRYALKGDRFEAFVRSILIQAVDAAELPGWRVESEAVRFEGSETRNGREFDIVITFGSTILIGEVKCSSHPADPTEIRYRENLISRAVVQVRDQVDWIRQNWEEFREQVSVPLSASIQDHRILPVVVIDGCYGPGFPVDGVPVIDGGDLRSFILNGRWDHDKIGMDLSGCGRLYSNAAEAEIMLEPFLEQSPKMTRYLLACRPRKIPYGTSAPSTARFDYNDWIVDERRLGRVSEEQLRSIAMEFRDRAFARVVSS